MATEIMAPPVFHVGDRVRMGGQGGGRTVWEVVELDTNKTPVHDPQHAYKLSKGDHCYRFAYESEMCALRA